MTRLFNVFGYAPAIMVPRAVSLLVVVVFTRILTPSQFGLYSLIIVYGSLLDAVFLNWSRLGLLRFYNQKQENSLNELMPGSLLVLFIGIMAGGLIGAVLSASTDSTWNAVFFLLLMLYFAGNGFLSFGLNILRAREQRLAYVVLEVLRPSLGFGAAWWLVETQGRDYIKLSQGLFGVTALFGVFLFIAVMRGVRMKHGDRKVFMKMTRYAAPLLLVFFWAHFITASDRFFLNYLAGPAAVGMYAASHSLARPVIEILFNMVNMGEFPRLIKAFDLEGSVGAQVALKRSISYLMFLCLPSFLGLVLLAKPLSVVLVGEEYREGAPLVMQLVATGAFFAGLKSFVFDQIFHVHQKSMAQSLTLIPAALMTVVLNVMLIPSFGAVGAAWAGVAGYTLAAFLSFVYSRRYLKILWPVKALVRMGLATVLMGFSIVLVQWGPDPERLIFTIPVAVTVYFVVCWKSGVLRMLNSQSKEGRIKGE